MHLLHMLGQRSIECQHLFGFGGFVVLELYQAVVVVDDKLSDFVVAFLTAHIFVEHVAQIDFRFGMGEAQHVKKLGFQGEDFGYIISARQVIHCHGQHTGAEAVADAAFAYTFLYTQVQLQRYDCFFCLEKIVCLCCLFELITYLCSDD